MKYIKLLLKEFAKEIEKFDDTIYNISQEILFKKVPFFGYDNINKMPKKYSKNYYKLLVNYVVNNLHLENIITFEKLEKFQKQIKIKTTNKYFR